MTTPARPRTAWTSFVLPAAWLVGAVAVALSGLQADSYLVHVRGIPPPHPYPTFVVLWCVGVMAVDAAALQAILRPASYHHAWGRALLASVVSIGLLFVTVLGSMHAPPPLFACLWWLVAMTVALLGLLAWSALSALRSRLRLRKGR